MWIEEDRRFYVIGAQDNLTSFSAETEEPEFFNSQLDADRRAGDLARNEPGVKFYVCQAVEYLVAPVGEVEVHSER